MKNKLVLQQDIDSLEEARILLWDLADKYKVPDYEVTRVTCAMWGIVNKIVKQES
jgi:hypothetical protein